MEQGTEAHICNPSTQEQEQKFKASLGYMIPVSKQTNKQTKKLQKKM